MNKQVKINERHTDLESDNDKREWNQTFCFFGDFISAKLLAPRGIGPLRHSHRETIWLAERSGPRSTPSLDGRNYPFKSTRPKQHSERPDEDWGWSQSTSHELWGRFCTWMTCWETFSPKPRRHLADFRWKSIVNTRLREVTWRQLDSTSSLEQLEPIARCLWLRSEDMRRFNTGCFRDFSHNSSISEL